MLNSDLILLNVEVETASEVIQKLGSLMFERNFVKDSYINAVLEREKSLPTGLPTEGAYVAIPHTDSSHVNQSNVAIAILKKPVEFSAMVDPNEKLKVELVFLLAVKDPDSQVQLLKSLMYVFQNKELLLKLKGAKTKEEIMDLLNFIVF